MTMMRRRSNNKLTPEGKDEGEYILPNDNNIRGKTHQRKMTRNVVIILVACVLVILSIYDSRGLRYEINTYDYKDKTCVITISAMNNFGFVEQLYDSIIENSPEIDCFVWFIGDKTDTSSEAMTNITTKINNKRDFSLVTMDDLAEKIKEFDAEKLTFMYDMQEFQTTIKPFAIQYTFEVFGAKSAIYLDNDVWVTGSLKEIQLELSQRSVVLTPHMTTPFPEDTHSLRNIDILQAGIFNFGFVAFSNTHATKMFLRFWKEQLAIYGFMNKEKGMFFDQIWGTLIPNFFDHNDYFVIRDHRYNIAYWNLHERGKGLHMKDGLPHIMQQKTQKSEKVIFMHFSGMSALETYDIEKISKYQTRFTMSDFPKLKDVFLAYLERLNARECLKYRSVPYGYGSVYSNGAKIQPWMRAIYAAAVYPVPSTNFPVERPVYDLAITPYLRSSFRRNVDYLNPFCASENCMKDSSKVTFFHWLLHITPDKAVDMDGAYYFSTLELHVWQRRPDLQASFPDPSNKHHFLFKQWMQSDSPVKEEMVDKNDYQEWLKAWKYQQKHHATFHKPVLDHDNVGVNIYGWHGGMFSIGIVANKYVQSALLAGLPVNAIHATLVSPKMFMPLTEIGYELTRSCSEPVNLVVMNAPETAIYHNDVPSSIRDHKYNIGYWLWELDVLRADWVPWLAHFDEIWCSASFIKNSIESSPGYNGTIVKVLPIPQEESEPASENGTSETSLLSFITEKANSKKPFVFLFVFDFQSFVMRKNPEASIRAFLKAFPKSEDPDEKHMLIMKGHSGTGDEVDNLRKIAKNDPRIVIINQLVSDEENKALHRYQDCHVSLHRSEGYGMNILESMASGVPVIATNYSANVDFFTAMPEMEGKCTFPVAYELVELEDTYGPYQKGNHWAEADLQSAALAMRAAAGYKCKNTELGLKMKEVVQLHFGMEAVSSKMKLLLNEARPRIRDKLKVNADPHKDNSEYSGNKVVSSKMELMELLLNEKRARIRDKLKVKANKDSSKMKLLLNQARLRDKVDFINGLNSHTLIPTIPPTSVPTNVPTVSKVNADSHKDDSEDSGNKVERVKAVMEDVDVKPEDFCDECQMKTRPGMTCKERRKFLKRRYDTPEQVGRNAVVKEDQSCFKKVAK